MTLTIEFDINTDLKAEEVYESIIDHIPNYMIIKTDIGFEDGEYVRNDSSAEIVSMKLIK